MLKSGRTLGVIVWPPAIQFEGVDTVLDNLQAAGVNTVATSTYVAEPAQPGMGDRREPPDDGGRGLNRVVDRPLWGQRSLDLRMGPSYEPDAMLFGGLKYAPPGSNDLTVQHGQVISRFIESAKARGLRTYLITHVSHLPTLGEDASDSDRMADVPRLPSGEPPSERMVNFAALASPDVQAYFSAHLADILTAYPQVDGLLLDRAEQSVYTLEDAFVDFGPHAERLAGELGLDFDAITQAGTDCLERLAHASNEELESFLSSTEDAGISNLSNSYPSLTELLTFRSQVTTRYLKVLANAATAAKRGVDVIPITFPPPMSLLTGANFRAYSRHADAVMIKFFTMHWPMIVTYWTQAISAMNPTLDADLLARTVSRAFDFEDLPRGERLEDYTYPGPDESHRAGTEAQVRKIREATAEAGDTPLLPSVHAYGPIDDVERRFRIGWEAGSHGMWINRYGYLSDAKLRMLARLSGVS